MKLCLVHIMQEEKVEGVERYYSQCLQSAMKVKRPDTLIEVKWPRPGCRRATDAGNLYFSLLNKVQVVERILEAGKEGFDAVIVLCAGQLGVREGAEMVDIPVVGETEAGMHLACQLGHKFAFVSGPEAKARAMTEEMIMACGLEDRAIPNPVERVAVPEGMTFDEVYLEDIRTPGTVAKYIVEAAKRCVERGADVVLPASTGFSACLSSAGISKIPDVEVPIIDLIAAAVKTAELRVDLKKSLGLPSVSRASLYSRLGASEKDLQRVRKVFGMKEL